MIVFRILLLVCFLCGSSTAIAQTDTKEKQGNTTAVVKDSRSYEVEGRKTMSKFAVKLDCNETGVVVVEIQVDREGKVVSAQMARGTTNSAKCLVDAAKAAALKTKFQAKDDAPELQTGTIRYDFKLTD